MSNSTRQSAGARTGSNGKSGPAQTDADGNPKRVPPHDLNAEIGLLSGVLVRPDVAGPALDTLTPDSFYKPAHSHIYTAIQALRSRGDELTPVILTHELHRTGLLETIGGQQAITKLFDTRETPEAAPGLAVIIHEHHQLRRAIRYGGELAEAACSQYPHEAVARLLAAPPEMGNTEGQGGTVGAVAGGDWILDTPTGVPAVWGRDDEVLWAEGEAVMVVGPSGVGKTTITLQLVFARLGLLGQVLGYPVANTSARVLYLAMDRPQQIRRAFTRLARPEHRDQLNEQLRVYTGPPPRDLARHPDVLTEMATAAGADTIVVDSLKDAAVGLTDDEVGAGYNRARQTALDEGIQVVELHHQRKAQNGTKPKTLEDVYGSTWITAGAGSVVLLWGKPGDSLVELSHLKQPGADVGPLNVAHDHTTGLSTIEDAFDLYRYLQRHPGGITAEQAAQARYDDGEPTKVQKRNLMRQLDRLTERGVAHKIEATQGGPTGTQPARWHPIETRREP